MRGIRGVRRVWLRGVQEGEEGGRHAKVSVSTSLGGVPHVPCFSKLFVICSMREQVGSTE